MTTWRPEGWKEYQLVWKESASKIYEKGADAMLEALRKEGTPIEAGQWTDDATFQTDEPGNVVWIPNERI